MKIQTTSFTPTGWQIWRWIKQVSSLRGTSNLRLEVLNLEKKNSQNSPCLFYVTVLTLTRYFPWNVLTFCAKQRNIIKLKKKKVLWSNQSQQIGPGPFSGDQNPTGSPSRPRLCLHSAGGGRSGSVWLALHSLGTIRQFTF